MYKKLLLDRHRQCSALNHTRNEMKIEKLISYEEVISHLNKEKRKKHLLLGNGFSIAYDNNIFSYNALSKFIENTGDPLINNLFQRLNTKNFELIMKQLESFS